MSEIGADNMTDRVIGTINKDIMLYFNQRYDLTILKVTDFQKGYWAQSPISKNEMMRLIYSLLKHLDCHETFTLEGEFSISRIEKEVDE